MDMPENSEETDLRTPLLYSSSNRWHLTDQIYRYEWGMCVYYAADNEWCLYPPEGFRWYSREFFKKNAKKCPTENGPYQPARTPWCHPDQRNSFHHYYFSFVNRVYKSLPWQKRVAIVIIAALLPYFERLLSLCRVTVGLRVLSLLYYSTTPFRSNYAAVSCSGSNLGESDFTPSVKNLFLHLWYVKFLKREVVLKNPTFSHLTRCNSAFSSTLSNFISAFFACIFFIYTRFRRGVNSLSSRAVSTPSLMAM